MMFETLDDLIAHVEAQFSNPNRDYNHNHETFKFQTKEIVEDVALLNFIKSSGKKALVVALNVKGRWMFFFPKYSHLDGFALLKPRLNAVEDFNKEINGGIWK